MEALASRIGWTNMSIVEPDPTMRSTWAELGEGCEETIVDDFDLVALPFVPDKADAPLVVDPDAVLACALRSQSL
jgi:hypothetical protein